MPRLPFATGPAEHGSLELRIGVNTGEALVRLGDRPDEREPVAAGHVVNTTSSIQTAASAGAVLVDEQTYRATADMIDYREAHPIALEGRERPASGLGGPGGALPLRRRPLGSGRLRRSWDAGGSSSCCCRRSRA